MEATEREAGKQNEYSTLKINILFIDIEQCSHPNSYLISKNHRLL